MELLFGRQSPLFGRMTGQWRLMPLPFGVLRQLLPGWSPEELVATYAIVGGVPAYLSWLNPAQSLVENIKQVMLAPGSLVLAEAMFLLQDEVREPRQWVAAQRAANALGFSPEVVGSHWSRTAQIDVVAINWQTHYILLGECKWGAGAVDHATVRELIAKAPLVPTGGFTTHSSSAPAQLPPPRKSSLPSKGLSSIWLVCTLILLSDAVLAGTMGVPHCAGKQNTRWSHKCFIAFDQVVARAAGDCVIADLAIERVIVGAAGDAIASAECRVLWAANQRFIQQRDLALSATRCF